ncbi:protein tyrosine phosphatase type IVA 3 isoform X4 [Notamacropus eugenii]|uniref:protein tyrosine phosphatase type IVA 3 isoform X4 n=1 Tax=Notamacropus eugenii TaxID=9315 RepID=UPI003B677CBB
MRVRVRVCVCVRVRSLACQRHVPSRAAPDWFPAAVLRSHTPRAAPHRPVQPGPAAALRCPARLSSAQPGPERRIASPRLASLRSAQQRGSAPRRSPDRSPPLAGAPLVTQSCWPLNSPEFMETPVGSSFEYCHAQHRARR